MRDCAPSHGVIEVTRQEKYIRSIRNPQKRDYAARYWRWLSEGATGVEPDKFTLTYMAAQAVRANLLRRDDNGSEN